MGDQKGIEQNPSLLKELERLAASDRYPFHMPGHKRHMNGIDNPYSYDITEIDGFDDLAEPDGIIAGLLEELRRLYDARKVFLSLNGSTGSNLIGIFAATEQYDEVLVASNCHRSVRHAAELRQLKLYSIEPSPYPEVWFDTEDDIKNIRRDGLHAETGSRIYGKIPGMISLESVEEAFDRHPGIKLVVVTSPSYEGVVSDIQRIAMIAHSHGAKLFVDEAHGAHFTIGNRFLNKENAQDDGKGKYIVAVPPAKQLQYFPIDALQLGADAVSVSLHKTLPMPGMTGLLLLPKQGGLSEERAAHYWQIFQSSSPSYLLMAMVDNGVAWIKENGAREFAKYVERLKQFYDETKVLSHLSVLWTKDRDPGKIVVALPDKMSDDRKEKTDGDFAGKRKEAPGMGGRELADILLSRYSIDIERVEENYIIAMTSVMDTAKGFERLIAALKEIDGKYF